jgi:hypothetical protein
MESINLRPGWEPAVAWQDVCVEKHAQLMVIPKL